MQNMIADGASHFIEVGPGNVLQGLMRKIDRSVAASKGEI
jgi:[acyl-carrier-protein] S-malonyltransferase